MSARDAIDREIDLLVDNALDELYSQLDRLRDKHQLTDVEMINRLDTYIDLATAEGYADWIREGES